MFSFFKKIRESSRPQCTALVAAAGSSSRMGGVNKLLEPLDGVPVLVRTLTALQLARQVDEIVVACREEDLLPISDLCHILNCEIEDIVRIPEKRNIAKKQ